MIVIFGGAFNPPTLAHKEIYQHVLNTIGFDLFIYLPVSSLYTKRSLASNYHRLQMLKLMTKDLDKAEVSTMEVDDSDYVGTYQSLLRFQEKYPKEEIAFVIGADNLGKLHKWINAKALLSEFKFIVINRKKTDILDILKRDPILSQYLPNFIVLSSFDFDMSSTSFRLSFDSNVVCKDVYEYINLQELYRGKP